MIACGLDFGTSNSAIGIARAGGPPVLAPLEDDATLLPSAVFFDDETRGRVLFGRAAIAAHVGQTGSATAEPSGAITTSLPSMF